MNIQDLLTRFCALLHRLSYQVAGLRLNLTPLCPSRMRAEWLCKTKRGKFAGLTLAVLFGLQIGFGQDKSAEIRQLEPDQQLQREISSSEPPQKYLIHLRKDEFIRIVVASTGIDLELVLSDAQGKELFSRDCPNGNNGDVATSLSFVAERDGNVLLAIKSSVDDGTAGRYALHAETPRPATEADLKQILSEKEKQAKRREAGLLISEAHKLSTTPGSSRVAMEKALRALTISQDLADLLPRAMVLALVAKLHQINGDKKSSLEYYEKTLSVIDKINVKTAIVTDVEGYITENVGEGYFENTLYEQLLTRFSSRLEAYQTRPEDFPKGVILVQMADAQARLRLFSAAESSYKEAIQVLQRVGKPADMAIALNRLGRFYNAHERTTEALKTLQRAEKLFEQSPNQFRYQAQRMTNLQSIRAIYVNLREIENMLAYEAKLTALQSTLRSPELTLINHIEAGNALASDDKLEDAVKIFQEGLRFAATFESADKTRKEIELLEGIILIKLKQHKIDEVDTYINQLAKLAEQADDRFGFVRMIARVGDYYFEAGRFETAIGVYQLAYQALMAEEDRSKELNSVTAANLIKRIGQSQVRKGDISKGLESLNAAFWMGAVFSRKDFLAENYDDLMTIFERLGNKRAAIFFGKQAVDLKQEIRQSVKALPLETQKALLKGNRQTYERLIGLLVEENRGEEAQELLIAYQSQEFYDEGNAFVRLSLTPHEQVVRDEINGLILKINRIADNVVSAKPVAIETPPLEPQVRVDVTKKLEQFGEEFSQPVNKKGVLDSIPRVNELRESLRILSEKSGRCHVAIYTLISRDKLFLFLNSHDGPIEVFESSIKAEVINNKLLQFYALLQSKDYDPRVLGKELYKVIIPPALEARLRETHAHTLMWSLDGNLRYVPMAALSPDGTHYLVELYNNVIVTRSDKEKITEGVSAKWTGYGFFVSEPQIVKLLSQSEPLRFEALDPDEIQIFQTAGNPHGSIRGSTVRESSFTRESLLDITKQRRPLIHISSHFRFYPGNPDLTFLLLGNGKVLTMASLKEERMLFRGVELLTLSACETAAQFPSANGREIDGFAELAQRLGAASVMASLWSVADVSTTQLMKGFYENRQAGMSKAEAMRRAQLDCLNGKGETRARIDASPDSVFTKGTRPDEIFVEPQYRVEFHTPKGKRFAHPYYWAPFVLFGNPR